MNPSRNVRCPPRPGISLVPMLSLLLGLYLQTGLSGADVPVTSTGQPTAQGKAPTAREASPSKAQPVRKAAPGSTLAVSAAASAPRKQRRATQRKADSPSRTAVAEQIARQQATRQRDAAQRAQRIGELLASAQLDYLDGRLFEPADNNAAARYKEVLTLDPTQPEALARTQRIADILAVEAEHAALAGDAPLTLQYILLLRDLQPQHISLPGLEARYQAVLANPVVFSARQKDRYVRSAQAIDEAYDKLKSQPLSLLTIEQVVRRYDRAETFVTRAPGLPQLKDRIILAFPAAVRAELADAQPRRALNVVLLARERGWFTPELEPLEEQAKRDIKTKWLIPGPPPRQP